MKIFKFLAIALVAMLGFTACEKHECAECGHEFIEHDHSADLVGTWTYLNGEGLADAMVINPDGSFEATGLMKGGDLYEEKGTIKVVNNKVSLTFEGDDEVFEGRLELVAGKSMSIVLFGDNDVRLTYDYCANDLSEEIVGMWVCNDFTTNGETDMMIETFYENGKTTLTGFLPLLEDNAEQVLNNTTDYKVVGDLLFITIPAEKTGSDKPMYVADKLVYAPNGTAYGDILTLKTFVEVDNQVREATSSWLRIKQHLELEGNKYDYIKTFVSNVSGEDKDIPFLNTSFNFAKMDGSIIDKFLKSILFNVEFPNENTINYSFLLEGQNMPMSAPIEVEGNKMTIKMSANDPIFHDVVVYTFQDKDNSQMHMYMPTSSFEKFFANTSVSVMLGYGRLDKNDADAIAAVYQNVADAVHSINLSLVMTKTK